MGHWGRDTCSESVGRGLSRQAGSHPLPAVVRETDRCWFLRRGQQERSSFPLKCAHGNETLQQQPSSCHAAVLENIIGSRIGQCTDSRPAASASCSLKNQIHQQLLPPTSLPTRAGQGREQRCARNNNGHDRKVKRNDSSFSPLRCRCCCCSFNFLSSFQPPTSFRMPHPAFSFLLSLSFPIRESTPLSLLR